MSYVHSIVDDTLLAVVLAAGRGSRMRSSVPKPLIKMRGVPLVTWVLSAIRPLSPHRTIVVIGPHMEDVKQEVSPAETFVQLEPKGMADALRVTHTASYDFPGDVLVVPTDAPMISSRMLADALKARRGPRNPAVAILGTRLENPQGYGRLLFEDNGDLAAVVEDKELLPAHQSIALCNAGAMIIDGRRLWRLLELVDNQNVAGEFYSTDMVVIARRLGWHCVACFSGDDPVLSVNTPEELRRVEALVETRHGRFEPPLPDGS